MTDLEIILIKLRKLEQIILDGNFLYKKVLSFTEACDYLDLSKSFLYKLTSSGRITYYCPEGKKIYFHRDELDKWLLRNRSKSSFDLNQSADNYLIKNRKGGRS